MIGYRLSRTPYCLEGLRHREPELATTLLRNNLGQVVHIALLASRLSTSDHLVPLNLCNLLLTTGCLIQPVEC